MATREIVLPSRSISSGRTTFGPINPAQSWNLVELRLNLTVFNPFFITIEYSLDGGTSWRFLVRADVVTVGTFDKFTGLPTDLTDVSVLSVGFGGLGLPDSTIFRLHVDNSGAAFTLAGGRFLVAG